jgi:fructose-1,6-bisphosphatase/inositol monophosphatase family enzyme
MTAAVQEVLEVAQRVSVPAVEKLQAGFDTLVDMLRQADIDPALLQSLDWSAILDSDAVAALKKSNKELVTRAEVEAEQLVRELVASTFPDHNVIGEELGTTDNAGAWTWVIDPVDGTSAMIRAAMGVAFGLPAEQRPPAFGFTIGMLHGDRSVAGIVVELTVVDGHLSRGRTWLGGEGVPTTCNGVPAPKPRDGATLDNAVLTSTVPEVMFDNKKTWGQFQALMEATGRLDKDRNCIGFMELLDGTVDIDCERDLLLPDVAALEPILRGAGFTVTDHDGNPLRYGRSKWTGEFLVFAAHPALHAGALATFQQGVEADRNTFGKTGLTDVAGYAKKVPGPVLEPGIS